LAGSGDDGGGRRDALLLGKVIPPRRRSGRSGVVQTVSNQPSAAGMGRTGTQRLRVRPAPVEPDLQDVRVDEIAGLGEREGPALPEKRVRRPPGRVRDDGGAPAPPARSRYSAMASR